MLLAAFLAAAPASAAEIEPPECPAGLAEADRLIEGVGARDKEFVANDVARNCRLLRQNLADMVRARAPMNRCLTGAERNEKLGRIDGSISEIRDVLAIKCK